MTDQDTILDRLQRCQEDCEIITNQAQSTLDALTSINYEIECIRRSMGLHVAGGGVHPQYLVPTTK